MLKIDLWLCLLYEVLVWELIGTYLPISLLSLPKSSFNLHLYIAPRAVNIIVVLLVYFLVTLHRSVTSSDTDRMTMFVIKYCKCSKWRWCGECLRAIDNTQVKKNALRKLLYEINVSLLGMILWCFFLFTRHDELQIYYFVVLCIFYLPQYAVLFKKQLVRIPV